MSKYSKIELFTVVGYGGNNLDNQGDILFSIDAQARLNLGFHNTQKMGVCYGNFGYRRRRLHRQPHMC